LTLKFRPRSPSPLFASFSPPRPPHYSGLRAPNLHDEMSVYDEIEIEDMTFDSTLQIYYYPCPCGDRFEIAIDDLRDGEEIAVCPSCSLTIRVIFEPEDLPEEPQKEQETQQIPIAA